MYVPGKASPATHVFAVNPGDAIGAGVSYANGSFTLALTDSTNHQSFRETQPCNIVAACPRGSVEWIVERPDDGASPLAQYGCVPAACAQVPPTPGGGLPYPVEITAGANATGVDRELRIFSMVEKGPPSQVLSSCVTVPRTPPRQKNPEIAFPVTPEGGILCGWSGAGIIVCDPRGCISEAQFCLNIADKLQNMVTGYAVLCGAMPPYLGGQARTSASSPPALAMQPNLNINVASVSKTMTAIGILKLLADNYLTIDSTIYPYLFPDWQRVAVPNVKAITFKDLLTQRSGFQPTAGQCGFNVTTDPVLEQLIQQPVTANAPAVYDNCNFAIFREMVSQFLMTGNPSIANLPRNPPNGLPRAQAAADFYVGQMNTLVFSPVGLPTLGCQPTTPTSTAMLAYPFPPGGYAGWDGGGDWTLSCGGGGLNMSPLDLFQVINDLANGNHLLTPDQKAQMKSNYLGWDNVVRSDCPNPYPCKNGNINLGNVSIWTYLGIFKCTVPVVVVVNSVLPSAYSDIIPLVEAAYNATPNIPTPKPCPPGSF